MRLHNNIIQHIKTRQKVSDARRGDDGVLEVRLGAVTKQMILYNVSTQVH